MKLAVGNYHLKREERTAIDVNFTVVVDVVVVVVFWEDRVFFVYVFQMSSKVKGCMYLLFVQLVEFFNEL